MKRVSRFKLYSWGFRISPFTILHFAPKEREISLFLPSTQLIYHPSSIHSTKPITSLTMILETIHSPLNTKPFITTISTPSSKFLSIPPSSIQSHTQMITTSLPPLPPLKLIQPLHFHFKQSEMQYSSLHHSLSSSPYSLSHNTLQIHSSTSTTAKSHHHAQPTPHSSPSTHIPHHFLQIHTSLTSQIHHNTTRTLTQSTTSLTQAPPPSSISPALHFTTSHFPKYTLLINMYSQIWGIPPLECLDNTESPPIDQWKER